MTWKPQPGPQEKAIRASFVDELFFGGSRGGGKSEFLLGVFASDVKQHGEHWRGVLFRRTYPELDELVERSRVIYHQLFPGAEYKVGSHTWQIPNGASLKMRHIESEIDADHYQGHQYTWIGWDELTSWSDLKPYHRLKACLRSAHDISNKRIRSTGNPGGPGHNAVKSYFIDAGEEGHLITGADNMQRMYVRSLLSDNRILLDNDPQYVERLKSVGDKQLVKAWLEGDWDAIVGAFFGLWNNDRIAVPSFQVPSHWPLFGALDYGEAAPTSFGLYSVDHDDNVYRLSEYYRANATASQHAQNINELIDGSPFTDGRRPSVIYADPSIFVKRRLTEVMNHSPADVFGEHGLWLTRANNDRVNGWRVINDALLNERFYCFAGWNDNLMRTVPSLPRAAANPEDLDTKAEDHAADELRYAMMHVYKPFRVESDDPTGTAQELLDQLSSNVKNRKSRYQTA